MRHVLSIAVATYKESIRSKVMYLAFFFVILLLISMSAFAGVSIGDKVTIIKDSGLFGISFFSAIYIIIAGSLLFAKELSKKTIINVLSKPISRCAFVLGKFFGLVLTVTVFITLLSFILFLFIYCSAAEVSFNIFYAGFSILLECCVVAAITLFFSSFVTSPVLSGAFSFAFFLAGRSANYLLEFFDNYSDSVAKFLGNTIYQIVPHLQQINVSEQLIAGVAYSKEQIFSSLLYVIGYCLVLLTLSCLFFEKKEVA